MPANYYLSGCWRIDRFWWPKVKYPTGAEGLPSSGTYRNIYVVFVQRSGSCWLDTIPDLGCNRVTVLYIIANYSTSERLGFLLPCIPPFYPLRLPAPGFLPFVWEEGYLGIFVIGPCRIRWIPFSVVVLLAGTSRYLNP